MSSRTILYTSWRKKKYLGKDLGNVGKDCTIIWIWIWICICICIFILHVSSHANRFASTSPFGGVVEPTTQMFSKPLTFDLWLLLRSDSNIGLYMQGRLATPRGPLQLSGLTYRPIHPVPTPRRHHTWIFKSAVVSRIGDDAPPWAVMEPYIGIGSIMCGSRGRIKPSHLGMTVSVCCFVCLSCRSQT